MPTDPTPPDFDPSFQPCCGNTPCTCQARETSVAVPIDTADGQPPWPDGNWPGPDWPSGATPPAAPSPMTWAEAADAVRADAESMEARRTALAVAEASVNRVVDETCECSPDGKCEHNGSTRSAVHPAVVMAVRSARPADAPTSYRELASVLGSVGLLLREARRARGLSLREAARQLGISFTTVSRAEAGDDLVLSNAVRILAWLDQTEIERGHADA